MSVVFRPFADESSTVTVQDLTIENRLDRVTFSGTADITRDKQGLEKAQALMAILKPLLAQLEAGPLPANVEVMAPTTGQNPFVHK